MVSIYKNMLDSQEIQELLHYLDVQDDVTDIRPDVKTKHPQWHDVDWPRHSIKRCLDQLLEPGYDVDEVTFIDTTIPFRLHVDSGDGSDSIDRAVLFPLEINPCAETVFFDNYWLGSRTKFSRDPLPQFHYWLPNRRGELQEIQDLRELYQQCVSGPDADEDFTVTDDFIAMLQDLISKRQGRALSPVPDSISDYRSLTNINDLEFDQDMRDQYLQHISNHSLRGLTLDQITPWHVGDCISFDRRQLHCASHNHSRKIFVTIFTLHPSLL